MAGWLTPDQLVLIYSYSFFYIILIYSDVTYSNLFWYTPVQMDTWPHDHITTWPHDHMSQWRGRCHNALTPNSTHLAPTHTPLILTSNLFNPNCIPVVSSQLYTYSTLSVSLYNTASLAVHLFIHSTVISTRSFTTDHNLSLESIANHISILSHATDSCYCPMTLLSDGGSPRVVTHPLPHKGDGGSTRPCGHQIRHWHALYIFGHRRWRLYKRSSTLYPFTTPQYASTTVPQYPDDLEPIYGGIYVTGLKTLSMVRW